MFYRLGASLEGQKSVRLLFIVVQGESEKIDYRKEKLGKVLIFCLFMEQMGLFGHNRFGNAILIDSL